MTKLILVLAATALLVLLSTDVINAGSSMGPEMTGTTFTAPKDLTSRVASMSGSASVQTSFIMSLLVPVALAALWSKFF